MNCTICSVAQKQLSATILYEDAVCLAYLPHDGAVVGHIHVVPKQHLETFEDAPDDLAVQLFAVASAAATAVYEGLGCQGTNILCNNGKGAGRTGHLVLDVLPRKEGDAFALKWEGKQLAPADFDAVVRAIADKAEIFGAQKQPVPAVVAPLPSVEPVPAVQEQPQASEEPKTSEEDYMVKHLSRIP